MMMKCKLGRGSVLQSALYLLDQSQKRLQFNPCWSRKTSKLVEGESLFARSQQLSKQVTAKSGPASTKMPANPKIVRIGPNQSNMCWQVIKWKCRHEPLSFLRPVCLCPSEERLRPAYAAPRIECDDCPPKPFTLLMATDATFLLAELEPARRNLATVCRSLEQLGVEGRTTEQKKELERVDLSLEALDDIIAWLVHGLDGYYYDVR